VRERTTANRLARSWPQGVHVRLPDRDLAYRSGDREVVPRAWLEGHFADWLRDRMGERGMTQRMLAVRSGVSHSTISRLLDDDDRQPTLATALALLRVLGAEATPVESLIRDRTG
jgi:DNA-binding XRE family transcriptional regulator